MKYLYDPPLVIKSIFNDFIWNTFNEKILLTFDDGPTKASKEIILKKLDDLRLKGLFFLVGNNIKKNPSMTSEIISCGHMIGNHTFNHRTLTSINISETHREIDDFNKYVFDNFGKKVRYFRPPHGKIRLSTKRILREKGMKNVMWSLLTYDYKNDLKTVKFALGKYLRKNSIIVLHDSIKSEKIISDAISLCCEIADKKGLTFGEPGECLN
ncbi:MAG: polysaccharide deacetylase family protein [Ignavibacteriaceae bacterium]|nr:polysaccharide deacetylase family protein [Ignavibacteriaceae bacterium]